MNLIKKSWQVGFVVLIAVSMALYGACSSSSSGTDDADDDADADGDGTFSAVEVTSTETSGDLAVGGTLDIDDDGNLLMRLNAIDDPDDPGTPISEDRLSFAETVEAADSSLSSVVKFQTGITCENVASATGLVDIVFVVDTTGSMSGTIEGVKDSITDFATAISGTVDAQFALVTFGDDVNSSTDLTDGFCDRPVQDFTTAALLQTFIDSNVSACGGSDFPENALEGLNCARNGGACDLTFRDGASRIFFLFTDASAHTTSGSATGCGSSDNPGSEGIAADPPSIAALQTTMAGDAIFTISNFNSGGDLSATAGCADPADMVMGGGAALALPTSGEINLVSDVPLVDFVGSGFTMQCDDPGLCDNVIFTCTVTDSQTGFTGTILWNGTLTCVRRD